MSVFSGRVRSRSEGSTTTGSPASSSVIPATPQSMLRGSEPATLDIVHVGIDSVSSLKIVTPDLQIPGTGTRSLPGSPRSAAVIAPPKSPKSLSNPGTPARRPNSPFGSRWGGPGTPTLGEFILPAIAEDLPPALQLAEET